MDIQITFRKVPHAQSFKAYTYEKVQSLIPFLTKGQRAHVIVSRNGKSGFVAEMVLSGHNMIFRAEAASQKSMQAAVDGACLKMLKQVAKKKDRIKDHKQTPMHERAAEFKRAA